MCLRHVCQTKGGPRNRRKALVAGGPATLRGARRMISQMRTPTLLRRPGGMSSPVAAAGGRAPSHGIGKTGRASSTSFGALGRSIHAYNPPNNEPCGHRLNVRFAFRPTWGPRGSHLRHGNQEPTPKFRKGATPARSPFKASSRCACLVCTTHLDKTLCGIMTRHAN